MVHQEALESVVMPYMIKAERDELGERGDQEGWKPSKRVRTYQHTAHRPHPKNRRGDVCHSRGKLEITGKQGDPGLRFSWRGLSLVEKGSGGYRATSATGETSTGRVELI